MDYQTVFDIADAGYKSWSFPAFGLIFLTVGIGLVGFRKRFPGWWGKHPRASSAFSFFFLGFAVLWTVLSFAGTYTEYATLSTAAATSRAKVVEGVVASFQPMPFSGHAMERFCVKDVCFEYSDYVVTAGFNNTASHGGPIKEGLPVRVTYVGNAIVKLEVGR